MMTWAADGYWADGWSWPGLLLMAAAMVMCAVMMGRMMGHHWGGSSHRHGGREEDRRDEPERTLASRLASGEIDVDEYERLLEVLRRDGARVGHEEVRP